MSTNRAVLKAERKRLIKNHLKVCNETSVSVPLMEDLERLYDIDAMSEIAVDAFFKSRRDEYYDRISMR